MTAKQKKALAFLMVYLLGYLALFIHFTSLVDKQPIIQTTITNGTFYRQRGIGKSPETLVFLQNDQTYFTYCPRLRSDNDKKNFCENFPFSSLGDTNFPTLPFENLEAQIEYPTKLNKKPATLITPLQFSYIQNNQPKTFAISDKSYQSIVDFNHSIRWLITLLVLIIAFVIFRSYFKAEIHHWFEIKFPWFKRFRKESPQIN